MKALTIGLLLSASLLLNQHAIAASTCSPQMNSFFFINGVSPDADRNRDISVKKLVDLLALNGVSADAVPFTSLRNPSNGITMDVLVEMTNMKIAEAIALGNPSTFQKAWYSVIQMVTGDPSYVLSQSDLVMLSQKYPDLMNRANPAMNLGTVAVIQSMSDQVSAAIRLGEKAIIISHSQGNMFSNAVFRQVSASNPSAASSIGIVSVATPAAEAQDMFTQNLTTSPVSGRYITGTSDLVINWLASFQALVTGALQPLPSNTSSQISISDITGHGFVESYIAQPITAASIVAAVQNAIAAAINPPCPQVAAICPDTFTQTQLSQVTPGLTVSQVDGIFGCAGRNAGVSNWYMWYNNVSLMSMTLNTASVFFTNGVYLAGSSKSISGTVIP